MQQRNLIIFAVLSIALVGSWYFLIGPPDFSKDDPSKKVAQNTEKDKKKEDDKKPQDKQELEINKGPEIKEDPEKKKKPDPERKQPINKAAALKATLRGDGVHLTADMTSR